MVRDVTLAGDAPSARPSRRQPTGQVMRKGGEVIICRINVILERARRKQRSQAATGVPGVGPGRGEAQPPEKRLWPRGHGDSRCPRQTAQPAHPPRLLAAFAPRRVPRSAPSHDRSPGHSGGLVSSQSCWLTPSGHSAVQREGPAPSPADLGPQPVGGAAPRARPQPRAGRPACPPAHVPRGPVAARAEAPWLQPPFTQLSAACFPRPDRCAASVSG